MKRILIVLLVGLLVFAGCARKNQETNITLSTIDTEQSSVELEVIGAEYRALWNEAYKYDTPILIESLSAWKEFFIAHPEQSTDEDILEKDYDEAFFEHSVIYAYVKSEGSGSIRLKVKGAELKEDKLRLFMERIVPEMGTDDMATRICLFGINRDSIKDVKTVETMIEEK